ncbi:lytic transglycosylase domain-containing protein [Sulfurospirillum arcachonense]|uniref:lytic transglycosylase domain-containing protein n=1 Tax=Sulfurospirillum arcachonense TaxID=57666 RepID=UPI00046A8B5A|nr:lytic transglycosylase domain-containing protein [Sulfurospirillum arcachonense]
MHFRILSRGLFLCLLFSSALFSATPKDLSFFDDKPRGIAKDFYIYRYLQKPTTTPKEAWKLLEQTSRMSMKLFHAYAAKWNEPEITKISKCLKMKLKPLLETNDDECLAIKFSPYLATKISKDELKSIEKRLSQYDISKSLHVLYSDTPFKTMLDGNERLFFDVFNRVGSKYRRDFFDHEISKEKIKKLEKYRQINQTIKYVITDNKMKNFNKSLIHVNRFKKTLTHHSLFFLGLNALKLRYNKLAMAFFDEAYKKAYYRMDKDKVLFWQFLVSKDEKYKEEIIKSFDLNIYTLLSGVKNDRIMIAKAWEQNPNFDEKNPFLWTKLLKTAKNENKEELETLAQKFLYGSTLPHFSFLMEKASGYHDHYFPIPYTKYLEGIDKKRIALIMAIARQESRLVPSAISHSYALGMMQFMPFLAKAIAKQEKLTDFDLDDMFNPKVALKFANIHLDYLEHYLYHPLFIAYAYNGGIGFTKRLLKSGTFQKGPYEPFMSMELVHYDESRKYGKKVLANYITYMQILHQPVSVYTLFEDLTKPEKTDKFRD